MANPFVHLELSTTDIEKAKAFYGALFDWKLQDVPIHDGENYTIIDVGGGTGGGMMKIPRAEMPSMWLAYVDVARRSAKTSRKFRTMAHSASSPTRQARQSPCGLGKTHNAISLSGKNV